MFSSPLNKQKHQDQTRTGNHDSSSLLEHQELKSTGSGSGSGSGPSYARGSKSVSQQLYDEQQFEETQEFLKRNREGSLRQFEGEPTKRKRVAKLAREETIEVDETKSNQSGSAGEGFSCCRMIFKSLLILLLIFLCLVAAIYCLPYLDIDARVPAPLPNIPFNFREGSLKPSTASHFRVERLFAGQIHGPESIALDSFGNMYMAVDGGFIMYAHLNKSSPLKKHYYDRGTYNSNSAGNYPTTIVSGNLEPQVNDVPELIKIAELNGIKQLPQGYEHQHQKRKARDGPGLWRRECQLDEKVYGKQLTTMIDPDQESEGNEIESSYSNKPLVVGGAGKKFLSKVVISRCSKPLGIRLSPDENYLYVIDTLSGLYKINLRNNDKPGSQQRLVNKLIDFKSNKRQLLPVVTHSELLSDKSSNHQQLATTTQAYLNISLKAVDDLAIDYGAGSKGGDLIYMSDASQSWRALSYWYDLMEGKPSGAILRYDSGSMQLSVLDPKQVAHVRTSSLHLTDINSRFEGAPGEMVNNSNGDFYYGIGAPRLDENDVFDDRPLNFPNGLQLTDDREALLIADSSNKRILKHYIRGPRKGTSDLWSWTPMVPDNIRRGSDRKQETYWVVGCGNGEVETFDILSALREWPRIRKFIMKYTYLYGWIVEQFGLHIMNSIETRDKGYGIRTGHTISNNYCNRAMILQYNKFGDVIRSIHSKEFPNDLSFYSQVNEVFDYEKQEHILYLSSPTYSYITKLLLPKNSQEIPTTNNFR